MMGASSPSKHCFAQDNVIEQGDTSTNSNARSDVGSKVTVEVQIKHKMSTIECELGESVLLSARRARLGPPFSCQSGNCGKCKALVEFGSVTMRRNNALSPRKVKNGWVLTCQALPASAEVKVNYDALSAPLGFDWLFRRFRKSSLRRWMIHSWRRRVQS